MQKLMVEKNKRTLNKRWSNTLPPLSKTLSFSNKTVDATQRYIPKEESAGLKEQNAGLKEQNAEWNLLKKFEKNPDTLIGSCRAARIKEDNNNGLLQIQEHFKTKSLIRN